MVDTVNASEKNAPGQGSLNNAPAEQVAANSQPDNDAESRGYSRGYSAGRKELLAKLGVDTPEQIRAKLESLKEVETTAQAKLMAESQDKETLARKLQSAETELVELKKHSTDLKTLRDTILRDKIKTAGIESGIRNDALNELVYVCSDKVSWKEDYSTVKVISGEGNELEGLPALMEEIKASKPFLFAPTGRQGSGVIPRVIGDPVRIESETRKIPSLRDVITKRH
jgi:hypothetical protein